MLKTPIYEAIEKQGYTVTKLDEIDNRTMKLRIENKKEKTEVTRSSLIREIEKIDFDIIAIKELDDGQTKITIVRVPGLVERLFIMFNRGSNDEIEH